MKFLKCVDPNPYCQRWLCQGILLTERFPKFGCEGSNQRESVCGAYGLDSGTQLYEAKVVISFFLSFFLFLLILARSNFDHYARECNFGILKKKQKQNKKNKNKTKNKKNLSAVFLTK